MGLMVRKRWAFKKGGRPVIYQPLSERGFISKEIEYRHVTYDPTAKNKVDWTHEREWRIKADEVSFLSDEVTIILPNRTWVEIFIEDYARRSSASGSQAKEDAGSSGRLRQAGLFPWHYVALDDLGYPVQADLLDS